MALGFEDLVTAAYGTSGATQNPVIFVLLPACTFGVLGLRFFWAVVNIRRLMELSSGIPWHSIQRSVVLLHFPLLVMHGVAFCYGSHLVAGLLTASDLWTSVAFFLAYYSVYQILNAVWLAILLRRRDQNQDPDQLSRETVWIVNNIVVSCLTLSWVLFAQTLGAALTPFLVLGCCVLLLGSVIDFWLTAHHYLEDAD
jgi:hypothetical protein